MALVLNNPGKLFIDNKEIKHCTHTYTHYHKYTNKHCFVDGTKLHPGYRDLGSVTSSHSFSLSLSQGEGIFNDSI